ncbi:hypothetical protein BJX70DRAFT_76125 [Aspergillus crustosus]
MPLLATVLVLVLIFIMRYMTREEYAKGKNRNPPREPASWDRKRKEEKYMVIIVSLYIGNQIEGIHTAANEYANWKENRASGWGIVNRSTSKKMGYGRRDENSWVHFSSI